MLFSHLSGKLDRALSNHLYIVVYLSSYKIYNPSLNNMCVQDRCPLDRDLGILEYRG